MKVKFVPQNVEFEIQPGQSVMHVAQDHNIYIKSVCKGVPSCAECRVRVLDGDHNVLPPGTEELSLIGSGHFIDHRRLSCQLKCFGDITVDMHEQLQKQQGLIGGQKKKKLAIKDDRIEDAHAIRADSSKEESTFGEGASAVNLESPDSPEMSETKPRSEQRPPRPVINNPRKIGSPAPEKTDAAKTEATKADAPPAQPSRQPNQQAKPRSPQGDRPQQQNRGGGGRGRPNEDQAPRAPQPEGAAPDAGGPARRKRRRGGSGRGGGGGSGGARPQNGGGGNGPSTGGGGKPPANS